jgi:hypothetical protein
MLKAATKENTMKLITQTNFLFELFNQSDLFTYPNEINNTEFWISKKEYNPLTYKKELKYVERGQTYKQFVAAKASFCQLLASIVGKQKDGMYEVWSKEIRAIFITDERFYRWNKQWKALVKKETHIAANIAHTKDDAHAARYELGLAFQMKFNALIDSIQNETVTIDYDRIKQAPTWSPDLNTVVLQTTVSPCMATLRRAIRAPGYTVDQRLYFWAYAEVTKYHNGSIPQYYRLGKNSERRINFGPLALQNKPKAVRDIVLGGYNKYDLNAAAFAMLLSQVDASLYPHVQHYIRDTKVVRQQIVQSKLSVACGVELSDVKAVITGIGFGANLSGFGQLAKKVSQNIINVIMLDQFVAQFNVEMKALRLELYPDAKQRLTKEAKVDGEQTRQQQTSLLAQSLEFQVINFIRMMTENPTDCLLVHDEIYTVDILDVAELQSEIKTIYGIDVGIK